MYLREIESKEKNYEESYFGHRPRSGIENRWPKGKAKVKGVLLLELFGSLIPKISINFGIRIFSYICAEIETKNFINNRKGLMI